MIDIVDAVSCDFSTLAHFHKLMFLEIGAMENQVYIEDHISNLERAFVEYLDSQSKSNSIFALCAKSESKIIGSACLTISSWPPTAIDLLPKAALIHSIYVLPDFRRKGIARRMFSILLQYCEQNNIKRLQLGASSAARCLYESFGFMPNDNRLFKTI